MYGKIVDHKKFHAFGANGLTMAKKSGKFEDRSRPMLFMGYAEDGITFRMFYLDTFRLGTCRSIKTYEEFVSNAEREKAVQAVSDRVGDYTIDRVFDVVTEVGAVSGDEEKNDASRQVAVGEPDAGNKKTLT